MVQTCGCGGSWTATPGGGFLPTSFTPGGVLGAIVGAIPGASGSTPPTQGSAGVPPGMPQPAPAEQVVSDLQQAGVVELGATGDTTSAASTGGTTPPTTPPGQAGGGGPGQLESTPGQTGTPPGQGGGGRR